MNEIKSPIVLSTRIRLARNLKGIPFPWKMNEEQKKETAERLVSVLRHGSPAGDMQVLYMDQITREQAFALVECHRISPEFAETDAGRVLLWNADGTVSVMINEEDHIRVQITLNGEQMEEACRLAENMDHFLEEKLPVAFHDHLGYLMPSPNNLGTGMRASLMLHLPALKDNGSVQRTAANLAKLGLTVRGIYGGGSEPQGAIYQISNQVTLGLSEKDAVSNLNEIVRQVIRQEAAAQQELMKDERMQDTVLRSLGILKTARLLKLEEFMTLQSNLRMGLNDGLIEGITTEELNRLVEVVQPAALTVWQNVSTGIERDRKRAEMVKKALSKTTERIGVE